jgi:hypothetical protein
MTEEARLQRIEDQLAEVIEQMSGGPSISWERSVRGRLHKLTNQEQARVLREQELAKRTAQRFTRGQVWFGGTVAFLALLMQFITLVFLAAHG